MTTETSKKFYEQFQNISIEILIIMSLQIKM